MDDARARARFRALRRAGVLAACFVGGEVKEGLLHWNQGKRKNEKHSLFLVLDVKCSAQGKFSIREFWSARSLSCFKSGLLLCSYFLTFGGKGTSRVRSVRPTLVSILRATAGPLRDHAPVCTPDTVLRWARTGDCR